MSFIPAQLIRKKRFGGTHSSEELAFLVNQYASGKLPDYQMAAWIMAVCFQGMQEEETAQFTRHMRDSGTCLDFSHLQQPIIDKHSTGGVGDKTSLILAPLLAAAGVKVPMIAGRGLAHTGGTLDKLESIPGFTIDVDLKTFQTNVERFGFSLIGQTKEICPADKKLYALRDVTGTVDSLPLICGSIMSKKLAEGLTGLVLDVKFGSGAFMKTLEQAEELALFLKKIGELNGVTVHALLTNMNQPLGAFVGNALEVKECIEIMQNETRMENGVDLYSDTRELTLHLASHMLLLGEKVSDPNEGLKMADELLKSGRAYEKFLQLLDFQGPADLTRLPEAKFKKTITAPRSGFIARMDTEQIGLASLILGAGRQRSEDKIDYAAGIEFHCQLGQKVQVGDRICTLFADNKALFSGAEARLQEAIDIENNFDGNLNLIAKVIC